MVKIYLPGSSCLVAIFVPFWTLASTPLVELDLGNYEKKTNERICFQGGIAWWWKSRCRLSRHAQNYRLEETGLFFGPTAFTLEVLPPSFLPTPWLWQWHSLYLTRTYNSFGQMLVSLQSTSLFSLLIVRPQALLISFPVQFFFLARCFLMLLVVVPKLATLTMWSWKCDLMVLFGWWVFLVQWALRFARCLIC